MTIGRASRIHFGGLSGGRPYVSEYWIISAATAEIAGQIKSIWPQARRGSRGGPFDIDTRTDRLACRLTGPGAVSVEMKLWKNARVAHHCDGRDFLSPVRLAGRLCGCPPGIDERKTLARMGSGPQPVILLKLSLHDAPDAGAFEFASNSWDFLGCVSVLPESASTLELRLTPTTVEGRSGFTYIRPSIFPYR
ncbi:hypothetical protein [Streptomyces uncialis]|uniref:hypothetical protein n=1 Tax=Streptomyces uncialis TaxID=1048205 RepID=UPI00225AA6E2|nr:hypothetical protein [Streptomyces uncialis]MCX4663479.1 hypothetical protein [Streptomyces uncialis]